MPKLKKLIFTFVAGFAIVATLVTPARADQYVDLGYDPVLGWGIVVQFRDDGTSSVYWYDGNGGWGDLDESLPTALQQ